METTLQKKLDPRVVRTRQMLREALIGLVLERGYDSINIQDITDRAGLRRATFYLHYRDKDELLMSMLQEVVDDLVNKMRGLSNTAWTLEDQRTEGEMTFRHVQERADLYRALLSGHAAARLIHDLREYLAARIRERCALDGTADSLPVPVEVTANYLAAVKLNMITWWLEQGMPYTPQEMAVMTANLIQKGMDGVLTPLQPAL